MTKFDSSRAVYFGGRRETGYTNDAFIFNLEIKVLYSLKPGADLKYQALNYRSEAIIVFWKT